MADINMPTGANTKRSTDAAFDLNLAPFLDIIVAIIPMLLLSAVFVEIKTIETPVPTLVAEAVANADQKTEKEIVISLSVSRKKGYEFTIDDKGKKSSIKVGLSNGQLDYNALLTQARAIKERYPEVFRLQLSPDRDVSFDEVVKTMDQVRKQTSAERKIAFVDPKTGQKIETDLIFPNVTFANVVGE